MAMPSEYLVVGCRVVRLHAAVALAEQNRVEANVQATLARCAENNNDEAMANKLGLTPHHIPILDNSPPSVAQMQDFVAFASGNQPCYVHCEAGKGRTGTAVASYRMAVDGWSTERAIDEGKKFGLAMPNQIEFLQKFGDSLGLSAPAAPVQSAASADAPPA